MKGPGLRTRYDVRRVWRCPVCDHREKALGQITWKICRCQQNRPEQARVLMQLIADAPPRPPQFRPAPEPPMAEPASIEPSIAETQASPTAPVVADAPVTESPAEESPAMEPPGES